MNKVIRRYTVSLLMCLGCVSASFPQHVDAEALTIRLEDGSETKVILLDNESAKIFIDNGTLVIHHSESVETLPLTDVKSIGAVKEQVLDSYVNEYFTNESDNCWQIFNTEGILIDSGEDGQPNLSILPKGDIYIIKRGNKTVKYIK